MAIGHNSAGSIVDGYVLKSDLDAATGADVATLQQAKAWNQVQTNTDGTVIPLYSADSTTVLGSFTVEPSVVTVTTLPRLSRWILGT
jgi:hypothetical protein